MIENIPIVHSRSIGRMKAVQSGTDPHSPESYITATELAELRRIKVLYDAGTEGWAVTTLTDGTREIDEVRPGPMLAVDRVSWRMQYHPKHEASVVPVRIVEVQS